MTLAVAAGAVAVGGSIALLAEPLTTTDGHGVHPVSKARAYTHVGPVGAPSGCPSVAVLEAEWDATHVDPAQRLLGDSCADGWAVAAIDTNGYTTTGLFRLHDNQWQWTDRSVPCTNHQVPASLERDACQTN